MAAFSSTNDNPKSEDIHHHHSIMETMPAPRCLLSRWLSTRSRCSQCTCTPCQQVTTPLDCAPAGDCGFGFVAGHTVIPVLMIGTKWQCALISKAPRCPQLLHFVKIFVVSKRQMPIITFDLVDWLMSVQFQLHKTCLTMIASDNGLSSLCHGMCRSWPESCGEAKARHAQSSPKTKNSVNVPVVVLMLCQHFGPCCLQMIS